MPRIDTKRGRDALPIRREPYWYKLARDRHLGLRKLTAGTPGTWIARFRDDTGSRHYQSLGECSGKFDFDAAKVAAEAWFRDREHGVTGPDEHDGPATVAAACIAYVRTLRTEGRRATAHDAHMRFRRTVYGSTADEELAETPASPTETTARVTGEAEGKKSKKVVEPHEIAAILLAKIRAKRIRDWHLGLLAGGLSKASANRTLSALKAALNLAVRNRAVSPAVSQEWAEVQPLKGAAKRRELFLDIAQRRALLTSAEGGVKDLMEGAAMTGCRAGELTSARRSAFDGRTKSLTVTGKTGSRTIPLAPAAVELFTRVSRDKLPSAFLFVRDDGKPWAHSDWDELVKEAAKHVGLPDETCLYTLRHSFITQALLDGMSTLEVSKIVGTSLAMIEKHYGHLVQNTARERLARVQIV
jgi:integrase